MKPLRTPMTFIGNLKITNVSGGASLNFGPAIHKGHQANMKIETGEYIIGDEFNIGCPPEEDNENDNGNDNKKKKDKPMYDGELEEEYEYEDEKPNVYNNKAENEKRWRWVEGKWKRMDQIDTTDE